MHTYFVVPSVEGIFGECMLGKGRGGLTSLAGMGNSHREGFTAVSVPIAAQPLRKHR